jgi:hypothetical protein
MAERGPNRASASGCGCGRIALAEGDWKEKFRTEKVLGVKRLENTVIKYIDQSRSTAEQHKQEIELVRKIEYSAGQTRGLLTGVKDAIDFDN